jgi:uncharacterized protein YdhG (YjbR/CyaY superfamily)
VKRSETVGKYIAAAPRGVRPRLRAVRSTIRSSAPGAVESISYGIPFYSYPGEAGIKGRLCYFDFRTTEVRLYMRPGDLDPHAKLIDRYRSAKSALRFPAGESIPLSVIQRLVRDAVRRHRGAASGSLGRKGPVRSGR